MKTILTQPNWPAQRRITIDPNVRFGKPCIRGTRIAVADILNLLTAGYTLEEIPQEYPDLTKEDVIGALKFAMNLSEEPVRIFSRAFAQK